MVFSVAPDGLHVLKLTDVTGHVKEGKVRPEPYWYWPEGAIMHGIDIVLSDCVKRLGQFRERGIDQINHAFTRWIVNGVIVQGSQEAFWRWHGIRHSVGYQFCEDSTC